MKFRPQWYNQDSVIKVDPIIEANSEEEAREKAFIKHNGKPPAPLLYLEKVEG